jgi:hypothetical protein
MNEGENTEQGMRHLKDLVTDGRIIVKEIFKFLKMFQQDDTFFCTVFYSLQTAVHVSGETFNHHRELQ